MRHRRWLRTGLLISGLTLSAISLGCAEIERPEGYATPDLATSLAGPSPTASPTPLPPPTSDPRLNAVIAAVTGADDAALQELVAFREVPCTYARGSGGRPSCEGEREGAMVMVFPVVRCTGGFVRAEQFPEWSRGGLLAAAPSFVAASSVARPLSDTLFPTGATTLLFESAAGGLHLGVNTEGRVVSALESCDSSPLAAPRRGPAYGDLAVLQSTLADTVQHSRVPGSFALAVTDLQTGLTVGVNDGVPMASGCVMNLLVIIEVLRQVEAGAINLEAVDALIRHTIYASDASTAYDLYAAAGNGDVAAGVDAVSRLIERLGLEISRIDHPPAYQWATFEDNIVTATEMNAALAALYRGAILGPKLRDYLLEAMTGVKPGLNYLTAALGDDALVSHKNGFFWNDGAWVDNDTAIVRFGPNQKYAYAITFLSDDVDELYSEIPLAQELVREAWQYFSSRYP